MNNYITFSQVIASLEQNDQTYTTLTLSNKVHLIVSQRGGRIFGPFLGEDSPSLFWLNQALARPDSLAEFLKSGHWNLGGERLWIAPEVQYLVRDRTDFWGSIRVPAQMDPGQYHLSQPASNQCRLVQDITLEAHNLASGSKNLHLETHIIPIADPLRYLTDYQNLVEGITFAGYEQVISLTEDKPDDIMSEVWNLIQLNPGGQILMPASPQIEYTDYYEPIDAQLQTIHPHHLSLKITGDRQYKVSYKAAHLFGRLAYFNRLDEERAYLLVRNFFNNPATAYAEEPAHLPGRRGYSVHVYNDDGGLGGFGELECNGQTIGGETERSTSTDRFGLWLYTGSVDRVKKLIPHLIGVTI